MIYLLQVKAKKAKSCTLSLRQINVLFNDILNTFCFQLYGTGRMEKDHFNGYCF